MSNAMILIHPDGRYEEINIAGTGDLLGLMQDAVGGYIETVPAQGGMVLVVDEEGELKNKHLNSCATLLRDHSLFDVIVGDALVCRVDGEELTGLKQWQYVAVKAFLADAVCRVRVTNKYEDALDAVTCGHLDTTDLDPYLDAIKDALQKQIAQKSGGVQPAWIPVTERLPKVEGVYMESTVNRRLVYYASDAVLICEEDGTMFVSWLMAKADDPEAEHDPRWMDEVGNIVDIEPVAWMPLPEPYKPGED